MHFWLIAPKDVDVIWLTNLSTMSLLDQGYSRQLVRVQTTTTVFIIQKLIKDSITGEILPLYIYHILIVV